jgi:hypothetical protein
MIGENHRWARSPKCTRVLGATLIRDPWPTWRVRARFGANAVFKRRQTADLLGMKQRQLGRNGPMASAQALGDLLPKDMASGTRYPEPAMKGLGL